MRFSFDSNIALYALADFRSVRKTEIARSLLADINPNDRCVISTQVLKEFASVATRKLLPKLAKEELDEHLQDLLQLDVVIVDSPLILLAVQRHYVSQISFYDALIVEAAIAGGAEVLYSEDLQHGQRFGTLLVINPFR